MSNAFIFNGFKSCIPTFPTFIYQKYLLKEKKEKKEVLGAGWLESRKVAIKSLVRQGFANIPTIKKGRKKGRKRVDSW